MAHYLQYYADHLIVEDDIVLAIKSTIITFRLYIRQNQHGNNVIYYTKIVKQYNVVIYYRFGLPVRRIHNYNDGPWGYRKSQSME